MKRVVGIVLVAALAPYAVAQKEAKVGVDAPAAKGSEWAPGFEMRATSQGGEITLPADFLGDGGGTPWVVQYYRLDAGGWMANSNGAFTVRVDPASASNAQQLILDASKLTTGTAHGLYELKLAPPGAKPDASAAWKRLSVRLPETTIQAPASLIVVHRRGFRQSTIESGPLRLVLPGSLPLSGVSIRQSTPTLQAGAPAPGSLSVGTPVSVGAGVWESPLALSPPFLLGESTGTLRLTSPTSAAIAIPFTVRSRISEGVLLAGSMFAVLLAFFVRSVVLVREKLGELGGELDDLIEQVDRVTNNVARPVHLQTLKAVRQELARLRKRCRPLVPRVNPESVRRAIADQRKVLETEVVAIEQDRISTRDQLVRAIQVLKGWWSIPKPVRDTMTIQAKALDVLLIDAAAGRPQGAPDQVDAAVHNGITELRMMIRNWMVDTQGNLTKLAEALGKLSGEKEMPPLVSRVTEAANGVLVTVPDGAATIPGLESDLPTLAKLVMTVNVIARDTKARVSTLVADVIRVLSDGTSTRTADLHPAQQRLDGLLSSDGRQVAHDTQFQSGWVQDLESLIDALHQALRKIAGGQAKAIAQHLEKGQLRLAAAVIRSNFQPADTILGALTKAEAINTGLLPIPDAVHISAASWAPTLRALLDPAGRIAFTLSLRKEVIALIARTVLVGLAFAFLVLAVWGPTFVGTLHEWMGIGALALGLDLSVGGIVDKIRALGPKAPGV